jgi:hypothetical protein
MKRVRQSGCPALGKDAKLIEPLHLLIPSWEGQGADPEEKPGPASDTQP